jgi:hypothetical protein
MIDKDELVDTLKGFFGRANSEAVGDFVPEGTRQIGAPPSPRRSLKQIYKDCVDELDDDERDALDRLIEKMKPGLGPRPGRHTLRSFRRPP